MMIRKPFYFITLMCWALHFSLSLVAKEKKQEFNELQKVQQKKIQEACHGWYENMNVGPDALKTPKEKFCECASYHFTRIAIFKDNKPNDNTTLESVATFFVETFVCAYKKDLPQCKKTEDDNFDNSYFQEIVDIHHGCEKKPDDYNYPLSTTEGE